MAFTVSEVKQSVTACSYQIEELERSYSKAVSEGTDVRALAVINPGNPTGQCLSLESMQAVCMYVCMYVCTYGLPMQS